jgi:hypothetical protein
MIRPRIGAVTTWVLAGIATLAAVVLVGVVWSLVRTMKALSANAELRRDGVRATGTVVDNTMSSTPQRRLLFAPVVEFEAQDGRTILAAAQQQEATSWARGSIVEVAYDPDDPDRFVLAGPPERGQLVANLLIASIVIVVMATTMLITYRLWDQFRHDKGQQPISVDLRTDLPQDSAP